MKLKKATLFARNTSFGEPIILVRVNRGFLGDSRKAVTVRRQWNARAFTGPHAKNNARKFAQRRGYLVQSTRSV